MAAKLDRTWVDADHSLLRAYQHRQTRLEAYEKISERSGVPLDYLKDPEGYREKESKATEARLEEVERAEEARKEDASQRLWWSTAPGGRGMWKFRRACEGASRSLSPASLGCSRIGAGGH